MTLRSINTVTSAALYVREDTNGYMSTYTKSPYEMFSDDGRNIVMISDGLDVTFDGSTATYT